jgi:hypothetical protein
MLYFYMGLIIILCIEKVDVEVVDNISCYVLSLFMITRATDYLYGWTMHFWDHLIVYYQQMHLILILFNLKRLKQ